MINLHRLTREDIYSAMCWEHPEYFRAKALVRNYRRRGDFENLNDWMYYKTGKTTRAVVDAVYLATRGHKVAIHSHEGSEKINALIDEIQRRCGIQVKIGEEPADIIFFDQCHS